MAYLQPIHKHDHEGNDIQFDVDTNPANHVPTELVVHESAPNSALGDSFGDFSPSGTDPNKDSAQSLGSDGQTRSPSGSATQSALDHAPTAPGVPPSHVAASRSPTLSAAGPRTVILPPDVPSPGSSAATITDTRSTT
jgi:hypothetical protein